MKEKILKLLKQLKEVEEVLGHQDVFDNQKQYRMLTQKYAYLSDISNRWKELCALEQQVCDNENLLKVETDSEFIKILEDDVEYVKSRISVCKHNIEQLLVPPDPDDDKPVIMECRAGTGGQEAAIFVGDCVRMYKLFADRMGWHYELISCAPSEPGGFREYIMSVSGKNVHRILKYEGGTHRVQRVPETESQGRVHTSAITIAIMPEADENDEVDVDDKDLRIESYRASGAGGQHVNTTDSAVRITHLPTGTVSYCQEEKSQHKNKSKAMRLLKAKLLDMQRREKQAEINLVRSKQVGSGDRSERIRTYNFPQNRITDHRVNGLTTYNLKEEIMNGALEEVTNAVVAHFYQRKLEDSVDENCS